MKSTSSARKFERKSSRKKRGRSTKTSRATRASELSSSPTNFPRAYSAVKVPRKSEFMIDPNLPLSERMARRHMVRFHYSLNRGLFFMNTNILLSFAVAFVVGFYIKRLKPSRKKLICKSHTSHRKYKKKPCTFISGTICIDIASL